MAAIEVTGLRYAYGAVGVLSGVDFSVPEGSVYALLGPNGAGKTTLFELLLGLRRPAAGRVVVLGTDSEDLVASDRAWIGHVAETESLPRWMRLRTLESYLEPLYPGWDRGLADRLRRRFGLDADRRVRTYSRGEQMKAALLCALAARPRLLLLDEPFAGLDVAIRDELVRGVLGAAADASSDAPSTLLIATHDLDEVEALVDGVVFLDDGRVLFADSMEDLRARFIRVEAVATDVAESDLIGPDALGVGEGPGGPQAHDSIEWLSVERAGPRIRSLVSAAPGVVDEEVVRGWFPGARRVELRPASLREVFVALARREAGASLREEVRA